jgi:hypothetical protein
MKVLARIRECLKSEGHVLFMSRGSQKIEPIRFAKWISSTVRLSDKLEAK